MVFSSAGISAVEKELSRFRQIGSNKIPADAASVIMLAIGEDNTVLWANDNAHEFFGEKASGSKCYSLCHNKHSCCKNCISKAVINDGYTRRHKKCIQAKDGENSCFLIAISPITPAICGDLKSAMAVMIKVPHETPVFNSKVLVVDDNISNLKLIQKTLNSLGCDVVMAENGIEALEKFTRDSYDVVFMDIQMPKLDGYQTAIELRKMKERGGDRIPVIALSAFHMENCVKKCFESGMNDFIGKPFKKEDIIESLKKHVRPWGND